MAQHTNEQRIFDYMRNPDYNWTLGFYPNISADSPWAVGELPGLDWEIKSVFIHPCGAEKGSHWRLSLHTEESVDGKETAVNKRIFFNNSTDYLHNGFGQFRIGPGKDDFVHLAFKLPVKKPYHTLEEFVQAALHPIVVDAENYDVVYKDKPMSWFYYTNYVKNGNRECRHWTQAVARQFWKHDLLETNPTALFYDKNKEFKYDDGVIPKGTFYEKKPDGLKLADKGKIQQMALDESSWDFKRFETELQDGRDGHGKKSKYDS